jgi:para-aminobenzoate synthetase component 1
MSQLRARLVAERLGSGPGLAEAIRAVAGRAGAAILDSSAGHARFGRYSILACEPISVIQARSTSDPSVFETLAGAVAGTPPIDPDEPWRGADARSNRLPFAGGWIGYIGYEAGRWLERLPGKTGAHRFLPAVWLGLYDTFAVYDRVAREWWVGAVDWPVRFAERHRILPVGKRLARIQALLQQGVAQPLSEISQPSPSVVWDFARPEYEGAVGRAIEYIAAGDIFQVNLAQRFVVRDFGDSLSAFLRLRRDNPSTHGAYLGIGSAAVISASPELFLWVDGGAVVTRPIKGTRKRLADAGADAVMQAELLASAKDAAELAMIIDLERNDLGRVCEYGSVRVPEARVLETHPTVHHLVGTVTGRLREGLGVVDLLRATFPGGSITGAPKIRAMEIIDELEPVPRGVYCGSIGYLGLDGRSQWNIAIRTIQASGGEAEVYAGGGIVADSDPGAEYEETLAKAAALFAALGVDAGATARCAYHA